MEVFNHKDDGTRRLQLRFWSLGFRVSSLGFGIEGLLGIVQDLEQGFIQDSAVL